MPGVTDKGDAFEQLASSAGKKKPGLSLKARAVGFLSRREHSRVELERKLAPHADDPAELKRVLDGLEREQWLSDTRFAQGLARRKAPLQGTARIMQELRQHGLPDEQLEQLRAELQSTEVQRARQVWQKKFSQPPGDVKEYARQFRFLASRGFSANCLRQILGDPDDDQSA